MITDTIKTPKPLKPIETIINSLQNLVKEIENKDSLLKPKYEYVINSLSHILSNSKDEENIAQSLIYFRDSLYDKQFGDLIIREVFCKINSCLYKTYENSEKYVKESSPKTSYSFHQLVENFDCLTFKQIAGYKIVCE